MVLIKPDGIQRALIGKIIARFEDRGLKIIGLKMIKLGAKLSKIHYSHLVAKSFYPDLEKFITHHPIIAIVLEGKECIKVVRNMIGSTNSRSAAPGTIRGDFGISTSKNIIHGSDSLETAKNEIRRFFKPEELFEYTLSFFEYIYAQDEL